jgi:hypothetical protein
MITLLVVLTYVIVAFVVGICMRVKWFNDNELIVKLMSNGNPQNLLHIDPYNGEPSLAGKIYSGDPALYITTAILWPLAGFLTLCYFVMVSIKYLICSIGNKKF